MEHIVALAEATAKPLTGGTLEALAQSNMAEGWKADAAMLAALGDVRAADDVSAVRDAILILYQPWLRETAERFQQLAPEILEHPSRKPSRRPPDKGTCILFADGLRYDVGQKLQAALEKRGFTIDAGWHWSAMPPVTPTAKPAQSPITDLLTGTSDGDGFYPGLAESGKKLTSDRFLQLLEGRGYQVLKGEAVGDPSGLAWTECGQIDRTGHDQGWLLARRINEEVEALAERTAALLNGGWKEVQIVTDHGWLLLPGGLPKVEMPGYLVQDRWGRCAVIKPGSKVEVPQRTWHWSNKVWVGLAPGIHCFYAGTEYAHGSLTLQECLVPKLLVRAEKTAAVATIDSIKWVRMRCKVAIAGNGAGLKVDLRTKLADGTTSLLTPKNPKPIEDEMAVTLFVHDENMVGTAGLVVLLTSEGEIIDKRSTTVGGEE